MTQNKPMLELVLNLLTPFLIAGGLTDPTLARQAAAETIAAYNAPDQPLTVAQIITFALAAIDNLRLSLPEDVSLSMKLKLRGNANALNRASQKTAAMVDGPATVPDHGPQPPDPDPTEAMASLESAQTLITQARTTNADRKTDLRWGQAMTDIAAEYTAELPALPPDQRRTHLIRIDALSKIASMLGRGDAPPLKSRLRAGTAMPA